MIAARVPCFRQEKRWDIHNHHDRCDERRHDGPYLALALSCPTDGRSNEVNGWSIAFETDPGPRLPLCRSVERSERGRRKTVMIAALERRPERTVQPAVAAGRQLDVAPLVFVLALALIVRLAPAIYFDAEVADLTTYHRMADIVLRGNNISFQHVLFP